MDLLRGSAMYGSRSGSRAQSRLSRSVPYGGTAFLGMLEAPCFALLDPDGAVCKLFGSHGNENASERLLGGDQTRASRTFGGVTIQYNYPSGASAFVSSEKRVNGDANDWVIRQRYLQGGLVMLSGEYRDFGSTNIVDELEWRTTAVEVARIPFLFAETRIPSSKFDDARLLVGYSSATTIAIVTSDHSIKLALREVTAPDLDLWLKG